MSSIDIFHYNQVMKWTKSFYSKQYEWGHFLEQEVEAQHHEKVVLINQLAGNGQKQILELGAGGGHNAAAAADLGHIVYAIEMVPAAAQRAQNLASDSRAGEMVVIEGDFYEISLPQQFDVVCYWDGFGIGNDQEQRRLLKRVASWLKPDGCAIIECYTPWYAASVVGKQWQVGDAIRRYDFDARHCRWLDTWWSINDAEDKVQQSLRCYSPADLQLLLQGTGLSLQSVLPGGTMDWEKKQYLKQTPLAKAMFYTAKLVRSGEASPE
ncbi:MAG: class I SAM-dependent methyltransferase [Chloroflexota bacterium]